jgi:hypothetical protein
VVVLEFLIDIVPLAHGESRRIAKALSIACSSTQWSLDFAHLLQVPSQFCFLIFVVATSRRT